MEIMQTFEQNILNTHGELGRKWLTNLPHNIQKYSNVWELKELTPVKNLSYAYVLSGVQKSLPIILKLYCDTNSLTQETNALTAFFGYGAVAVLGKLDNALLLECAVPGTSLKNYFHDRDDEAIKITCNVIKKLHQAPIPKNHAAKALHQASILNNKTTNDLHKKSLLKNHIKDQQRQLPMSKTAENYNFPYISDWLEVIDKNWNMDMPNHYILKARTLKNKLLAENTTQVLLHGDLHHDNILQNGPEWVVIDPKGVIGEPSYEVAAFIHNPIPELLSLPSAKNIIDNRVNEFSNILQIEKNRILQWCFIQAVLAWIWNIEDKNDTKYFEKLTEIFYSLQ